MLAVVCLTSTALVLYALAEPAGGIAGARGPIGDFLAGTVGVAVSFAGAFLGILLAILALMSSKEQANIADSVRRRDDRAAADRDADRMTAELEKSLGAIRGVAQAYVSVVNEAITLVAFGQLRDNNAKATKEDLRKKNEGYGSDPANWPDWARAEFERADAEERDLLHFPLEDFERIRRQITVLAERAEEVFWNKPSRDLWESSLERYKRFVEKLQSGRRELPLVSASDKLLEATQQLQRKAELVEREKVYLTGSAQSNRLYERVISAQLIDWDTERNQAKKPRQHLFAVALVGRSFWGTELDHSRTSELLEINDTAQRQIALEELEANDPALHARVAVEINGDHPHGNLGLASLALLLHAIPTSEEITTKLRQLYLRDYDAISQELAERLGGNPEDHLVEAQQIFASRKASFDAVLKKFDTTFGLDELRDELCGSDPELLSKLVYVPRSELVSLMRQIELRALRDALSRMSPPDQQNLLRNLESSDPALTEIANSMRQEFGLSSQGDTVDESPTQAEETPTERSPDTGAPPPEA